jgi:hypothetical protein
MTTNISAIKIITAAVMLLMTPLVFNGCADYASVGVGYGPTYYAPDYTPYFAGYYYDGVPWWGPNAYYIRKKVVVKDVDKHVNINRNVYYGGHHLARDSRGNRSFAHASRRGRATR